MEEKGAVSRLTLLALVLRALFVLLEPSTHPVADERTWTNWAVEGLIPRHFNPFRTSMIFYPPLYPYFIGGLFAAFRSLLAVKWAQAIVGALLVPAVLSIGGRAFSPRIGRLAAIVTACYPELVWFSAHFWSETLFMTFLWWALERGLTTEERGGVGLAASSGLLWGLAILTRETLVYFTPIMAFFLFTARREGGKKRAASFLLTAVLVVAPWTYRNYRVLHAFIPVSTAGGLNLWQGNARLGREEVYVRYEQIHGRVEQYHHALQKGFEAIWERQPYWLFEKLEEEMPNFWEADSQALVHAKRGAYGPPKPFWAWATLAVVVGPYVLVLLFFARGLASLRIERMPLFLLGFLVYYNLLHVVSHGYARYRLPAMPVVFIFAALGWESHREKKPLSTLQKIALATVLGVILVSLAPSVRINLEDPAFGLAPAPASPAPESSPVP